MAILEDTPGLQELQQRMHLALVATPVQPSGVLPSVSEIFSVVENLRGKGYVPTYITTYAPDFILHFDSVETRDTVKNLEVLHTTTASPLSFWTPYYRNHTIPWDTKVLITVYPIPPNACHPDILRPLLSSYCDIRSSTFNKSYGTCQIEAFTTTVSAIPTTAAIGYRQRTSTGTILRTYPVSVTARAAEIPSEEITDHPLFKAFCEEYSHYSWKMLHTAEDILAGQCNGSHDTTSSEDSMDYDGYSVRMWDQYSPSDDLSDREPVN